MAYLSDRLHGKGTADLDVLTFCPPPSANLSEIAEMCDDTTASSPSSRAIALDVQPQWN